MGADGESLGFGPADAPLPSGSFPFPLRTGSGGGDGSGRGGGGGRAVGLGAFSLSVTAEPLRWGWEGAGEGVDGPTGVEPSKGEGRFFRGAALANISSSEKIVSEVFFRFSPLLLLLLWGTPFVFSLTEGALGSSFTGLGVGCGLEGVGPTGGFLSFDGALTSVPFAGPLSCALPPIFSLIVGRVACVGGGLFLGTDGSRAFETGSLSLDTTGVVGGAGGGMEGCALLWDSTVLLIRTHSD
jgi:hypothetical protein